MITLWIVRHGLTAWNVEKRYQGHSDIPLNTTGQQQAQAIATRMQSERLHALVSSGSSRTRQTATAIAAHHKLTIQDMPDLREANFGLFEGLRYKDVIEQYPKMAETWFADPERPPTDGERLSAVFERISAATTQLLETYSRKRVVIVGSDGALRMLLCVLLQLPAEQYWRFNLDPCSLTRVNVYPGGAILVRLNDACHLDSEG